MPDELDGAAFIPRHGDQTRSMNILAAAAGWYGAKVRTIDNDTEQKLRALFEYMAGWNADHQRGVTSHEIGVMRTAAREGLAILDGDHGTHPRP